MTAQFTRTNVRMNKMSYTQSRAFSEDFRKPVLVAGQDHFGELRYHKSKEQILREKNQNLTYLQNKLLKCSHSTMKAGR